MLWPTFFKPDAAAIQHWERSADILDWVWKENQMELKVDQKYMHIHMIYFSFLLQSI